MGTVPLKLQFTTACPTFGTPKSVIKRTTNQNLSEILRFQAYLAPKSHLLYYEMLDISIVELEMKKFFKVIWLGNTVKEEVYIMILKFFICSNFYCHFILKKKNMSF